MELERILGGKPALAGDRVEASEVLAVHALPRLVRGGGDLRGPRRWWQLRLERPRTRVGRADLTDAYGEPRRALGEHVELLVQLEEALLRHDQHPVRKGDPVAKR